MTQNSSQKNEIRKILLKKRLSIKPEILSNKSQIIISTIQNTEEYKKAKKILIYYPIKNEVDILALTKDKKNFFLPIIENQTLKFGRFKIEDKLILGNFKIPEPKKTSRIRDFDLIFLPAIAFDKDKNRIGYGKGFFDKYLKTSKKSTIKIGVCYEFQIVKSAFPEYHDAKVDIIITEKNTLK